MQSLQRSLALLLLVVITQGAGVSSAADWAQFRGPSASGLSADSKLPKTWSDTSNLSWKVELPGPGSSSPIVFGERVFVTCYSGYGVPKSNGGDLKSLQRHLVCVDRTNGQIRWTKTVAGKLPEDGYQGYITEHGYASGTPVADDERVYCFFGKSGVVAFDLEGNQLWQTSVGKESSNRRWGSGASLILHKDILIVNASEESQSVRGLDKRTGKELWKAAAATLELAYGTPAIVTLKDQRQELVVAVPGEVWGLNPETGKLQWFAEHSLTGNICPSIIADGETIYVFGGFRSAGSLAVRAGGKGDVTKTHVNWTSRNSSYVATPVLYDGHLYWISDNGQAFCLEAKTGKLVYRERVTELKAGGRPVYASPVVADGKIYVPSRWDGVVVLAAEPVYKVLAPNQFTSDDSDFNGSPAISQNQLFLRSNRYLYCMANKGQ